MTRKSLPSTNDGWAFSPPNTLDDEGVKLRSGRTVPPPIPGNIETSLQTIIGAAPMAVDAAADDDGFSPVSQSTGLKTTPFHLATATTPTVLTTAHAAKGGYKSSESFEEEDSPPLLPDRPAMMTTLNEDPVAFIAAIEVSEYQRNLAFLTEASKIKKIGRRASQLLESSRLLMKSMTTNTAAFTARLDGTDEHLAAIKCLLEESMVSSSKLADNVQMLSTQAVNFNNQWHRQGQTAFHRVQDVKKLVADFKSALSMVTHALEELVPQTI
jgi:hypothetical protein